LAVGPVRAVGLALVVAVLLAVAGCGGADRPAVRVAAASDLRYALPEVVDGFQREHPGVRVEVAYGPSGALLQQLVNGAPYELYLAADLDYPQRLVDAGRASAGDRFRYARGRLVVWAGDGSPVDPASGVAAVGRARRVAIANPAHAPYGRAAEQALRNAGYYHEVADRLVLADSVAQAAQFVADGSADVGIVAMALVLAAPVRNVGRWQEVPAELFPPLIQGGVVLPGTPAEQPARALRDYLTGPAGLEVLRRYGFEAPAG
jgi:molybdate transport system substrate-binding protein